MTAPASQRRRGGFTLLEVMIALSILVTSLFILLEIQATAALMTMESERILIATQLAQDKMSEVRFLVENEGFQQQDVYEEGEFDDFGDEAIDIEFEELASYHFEFLITEVDLGLGGDLSGAMSNLQNTFGGGAEGGADAMPMNLGGLPISEDMITEMLNPFLRQARVRVWWGEDQEEAEEQGNEVVVTTFLIQPNANMLNAAGLGGFPTAGGGGGDGGSGGGQGPPGRRRPNAQAGCPWCWGGGGFQGFGVGPAAPTAPGWGGAGGSTNPTAPSRAIEERRGGAGGQRALPGAGRGGRR
jgi:prepilin-type N-terminal cleavage/methylation domain-containing protein